MFSRGFWGLAWLVVTVLAGCTKSSAEPKAAKPPPVVKRFDPLVRAPASAPGDDGGLGGPQFEVAPFTPYGPPRPEGALTLTLDGEKVLRDGKPFDPAALPEGAVVLLVPVDDTFLAQVLGTLEALELRKVEAWLAHPNGSLAYPVQLFDEVEFGAWLDDPSPGKLRVVQRADGFELQTNMGKLPGVDPNGPSVPLRGGELDLATLRDGLEKIRGRFMTATQVCFLPSYGTPLEQLARAMAANYVSADRAHFERTCWVYPRRRGRDGG